VEEFLDLDLGQAELAGIETGDVLRVARRLEVALEVVGPGVERADNHAQRALALEQDMAAVHAHIVEGVQTPSLGADDEDRLVEESCGDVVAGPFEVVQVADELPGLELDLLLLALEDRAVPVVVPGQGRGVLGIVAEPIPPCRRDRARH
jgi:hypothetical protein